MANEINFCPGCGTKLQPDVNFCPKCGRQINAEAKQQNNSDSSSNVKDSLINIGKKTGGVLSSAFSGVTSKFTGVIDEYRKWDGELVRKKPLVLPADTPDTPVITGRGGATLGKNSTSIKYGKLVLTRKQILFYDVPKAKQLLPGSKEPNSLVFTINLADIDSFKKESNKLGMTGYSMMVKGEYCDIDFKKDPSRMIFYITKLAGLEGNLLNIKLRPDEKVIETCNISIKTGSLSSVMTGGWQFATLYLTNQRIVINKSYNEFAEGGPLLVEKELKDIDEIIEKKKAMNCTYTIQGHGASVTIKFPGIVPAKFLKLVKNGEGNAAQASRKSKLMKGAKVALFAASVFGADTDASADTDADVNADVDMDTDADMDVEMVDVDGDGTIDAIGADTDGDGAIDTMAVDADGDGDLDTLAVDVDGDGSIDAVAMDTDGDGNLDTMVVNENVEPDPASVAVADVDGDGTIDTVGVDVDGDGKMDAIGVDTDGDGTIDTVGVDVDGDGKMDAIGVDTDGDGTIDTVGVDVDGDGTIDGVGVDTDGDGTVDVVGDLEAARETGANNAAAIAVGVGAAVATGVAVGKEIKKKQSQQAKKEPAQPKKDEPIRPKKKNKTILIIAALVVTVGLVLFFVNRHSQQQPAVQKDLAGYEWLKGVWAGADHQDFVRLIITDSYYQILAGYYDGVFDDVSKMDKVAIELANRQDYIRGEGDGTIFGFSNTIGVDVSNKSVYVILGEFQTLGLHKIHEDSFDKAVFVANHNYPQRVYSNAYDGFVNIRESPSSDGRILGVLRNGPDGAVFLEQPNKSWMLVNCNGIVGYVYSKHIQTTPTEVFKQ